VVESEAAAQEQSANDGGAPVAGDEPAAPVDGNRPTGDVFRRR